jgi:hypothetical protein
MFYQRAKTRTLVKGALVFELLGQVIAEDEHGCSECERDECRDDHEPQHLVEGGEHEIQQDIDRAQYLAGHGFSLD